MKVLCDVHYGTMENDQGRTVDGVMVVCTRCDHEVQSYGQTDRSVKRCMVLLKEECPGGERNFYVPGQVGQVIPSAPPPPAKPVPFRMPRLIEESALAVIKAETTGLDVQTDQIVQVAIAQIDNGHPRWRTSINIRPDVDIQPAAAKLHGLTKERLKYAPTFSEVAMDLLEFIGPRVLIGYNIDKFLLPMLRNQFLSCTDADLGGEGLVDFRSLDLLILERRYAKDHPEFAEAYAKGHKLSDAVVRWGVPIPLTHDASNDVRAIWGVFLALTAKFPELGGATIDEAMEMVRAERALEAMGLRRGFGQGRGQNRANEVLERDR